MQVSKHRPTTDYHQERRRNVLWSWWLWALIVGFIVWSAGWGWGTGWGGWWFWRGGKTTAQIQTERQHEPLQEQLNEQKQELR